MDDGMTNNEPTLEGRAGRPFSARETIWLGPAPPYSSVAEAVTAIVASFGDGEEEYGDA